jgi:hypothetical protein
VPIDSARHKRRKLSHDMADDRLPRAAQQETTFADLPYDVYDRLPLLPNDRINFRQTCRAAGGKPILPQTWFDALHLMARQANSWREASWASMELARARKPEMAERLEEMAISGPKTLSRARQPSIELLHPPVLPRHAGSILRPDLPRKNAGTRYTYHHPCFVAAKGLVELCRTSDVGSPQRKVLENRLEKVIQGQSTHQSVQEFSLVAYVSLCEISEIKEFYQLTSGDFYLDASDAVKAYEKIDAYAVRCPEKIWLVKMLRRYVARYPMLHRDEDYFDSFDPAVVNQNQLELGFLHYCHDRAGQPHLLRLAQSILRGNPAQNELHERNMAQAYFDLFSRMAPAERLSHLRESTSSFIKRSKRFAAIYAALDELRQNVENLPEATNLIKALLLRPDFFDYSSVDRCRLLMRAGEVVVRLQEVAPDRAAEAIQMLRSQITTLGRPDVSKTALEVLANCQNEAGSDVLAEMCYFSSALVRDNAFALLLKQYDQVPAFRSLIIRNLQQHSMNPLSVRNHAVLYLYSRQHAQVDPSRLLAYARRARLDNSGWALLWATLRHLVNTGRVSASAPADLMQELRLNYLHDGRDRWAEYQDQFYRRFMHNIDPAVFNA